MTSLVHQAVLWVASARARELSELLVAAWGRVTLASSAAEAAQAVEGGATLLIAEGALWPELDARSEGMLRSASRGGALGVLLLSAQQSTAPDLVDVALPPGSSTAEILRALHRLEMYRLAPGPLRCRLPVRLKDASGQVLEGELVELFGATAQLRASAPLPAGRGGRLEFGRGTQVRQVPCLVVEAGPAAAGFSLLLRVESAYALWDEAQAGRPSPGAAENGLRLLVVDDSELLNRITASVLGQAGYRVFCTTSPFEITRAQKAHDPALILVDYNIPTLRGDKLVEITRRGGLLTPMVFYSNAPEAVLAEAARASGAQGYLPKGLPPPELLRRLEQILARLGLGPVPEHPTAGTKTSV